MKKEKSNGFFHRWKIFIEAVVRAKVPWYLYFLSFIMDAVSATLFVKIPVMLGDIMQGEIFSGGEIARYGWMSLAQVVFNFLSVTVFNWVFIRVNELSGAGLWTKIIHLPMKKLNQEKPSTLTSRVTDDANGISTALSGIFNCASVIYTLIVTYVEMFKINTRMAAALLIVPVWLILSMAAIRELSYRSMRKIQDTLSAFTSYLAVRLPNMKVIKAFGMEQKEQKTGEEKIKNQYDASMKLVWVQALASACQSLASALCNVIVLAYGSVQIANGKLDVGDLITFFLFVTQGNFTDSSQNLLMYYQNIQIGFGTSAKVTEIMDLADEKMEREKSFTVPEEDIVFDHVSFAYGETPVLKDVSFTVPKGKVTAIVGNNGSGKTTILKLLERFYEPDAGTIYYGKDDIGRYHMNEWRNSIGYVVQNSPLLKGTIAENIAYGMKEKDDNAVIEAAKEADAYEFIRKMEKGFESETGELGGKISGGQRQKIAIARALAVHPDMYLLDEATCGLDAESEKEIWNSISQIVEGKTVVMVTHNIEMIKKADHIVVLDSGKVAGDGTDEFLSGNNEVYRQYCGIA